MQVEYSMTQTLAAEQPNSQSGPESDQARAKQGSGRFAPPVPARLRLALRHLGGPPLTRPAPGGRRIRPPATGAWRAMPRLGWRHLLLLTAAVALAACNALTTSYNNAPTLLTWMADSYFDLDGDQETLLKDSLRTFRQWHRTQLPDYAKMLAEVQNRIARQVGPDDVAWLYEEGEKRYRTLAERAAPAAAELAAHLTHANLAYLEKKFAGKNADYESDYITAPLEKRQDKRYERVLAEAERWYGSFSREQKRKIRELTDALPADYPLVLQDRKRRQAELVAILTMAVDKTAPQDEVTRRLRVWVVDYERGRSPAYRDFGALYRQEAQKMFAAIANLASAEQRVVASANVQKTMDDFVDLALASN